MKALTTSKVLQQQYVHAESVIETEIETYNVAELATEVRRYYPNKMNSRKRSDINQGPGFIPL